MRSSVGPNSLISRSKQACSVCKRRKVKCDGELPCSNCSKHGHHCDYSAYSNTASSITSLTRPKKQNKDEYIKYLENRVQELEHQLRGTSSNSFKVYNLNKAEQFANTYLNTCSPDSRCEIFNKYQSVLPTQLAKLVLMSLPSDQKANLAMPRVQHYGWNLSGGHYLKSKALPKRLADLPIANERQLLDFFFEHINPLFSIIHESIFREQYGQYKLDLFKEDESLESSMGLYTAMVNLILAISIRFCKSHPDFNSDIVPDANTEEALFQWGYEVVQILSFEWRSCELIQCWILITFYLRSTHRQSSSYTSLGSAIRMANGMTLNFKTVSQIRSNSKPYEKLKFQRVFWLVFTWDRLYSFQSGRSYDINFGNVTLDFPDLADYSNEEDGWLALPAFAMMHLAKIAGDIQDNGGYREITDSLRDWESWSNKNLSENCNTLIRSQVFLTYHDIMLSFNNVSLLKLLDVSNEVFSLPASSFSHSESILSLLHHSADTLSIISNVKGSNQLFVPWWLNLSTLFHVSIICVILIHSGLYVSTAAKKLKTSLDILMIYKQDGSVKMASECVWVVKMLNHICVNGFLNRVQTLTSIGIDHGSNIVNKSNFTQFGPAGEGDSDINRISVGNNIDNETTLKEPYGFGESNFLSDDLNENLVWFDTWLQSQPDV